MGKSQRTICEADRILSAMPRTGSMWVHNVISGSAMACFRTDKEENADRFTNKLEVSSDNF